MKLSCFEKERFSTRRGQAKWHNDRDCCWYHEVRNVQTGMVGLDVPHQRTFRGAGQSPLFCSARVVLWDREPNHSTRLQLTPAGSTGCTVPYFLFKFRPCLVPPCKRKKSVNAKFCEGILLIWSTKWSLFTKKFSWMGCKSRGDSNETT